MSALAELRAAYRERRPSSALGYVGADVPTELIEAAGNVPLRLAPVAGVDRRFADAVLGPGVDELARAVLAGLLEGAYPIDRVVLCHDSDHTVRLYQSLRRLDTTLDIWFVDLLHLPRASNDAYNHAQLAAFADWLGGGDPTQAIVDANRARDLGARLAARRRAGGIAGADALAMLGAGTALPAALYVELLDAALEGGESDRRTVLLLGSDHADDSVYAATDELGAVVVAETHSWGEALLAGHVDEADDPLAALARHYGERPRVAPPPADLQIAWLRAGDETWRWSLPFERRRLGREIVVARTIAELAEALS